MNLDQQLDGLQARRMAAQDRYLTRLEKREEEAAAMVGELCRQGQTVYYINLLTRDGRFTSKTKESTRQYDLIAYLLRNGYV